MKKTRKTVRKAQRKTRKPSRDARPEKARRLSKADLNFFKNLLLELRKKIVNNLKQIEGETLNTSQRDASGDLSGYS
nr:hypothetical protein [Candidatus Omnitrophota bacterium]